MAWRSPEHLAHAVHDVLMLSFFQPKQLLVQTWLLVQNPVLETQ
jgi:hypothetical protein